jgi:hypothetical protein
MHQPEAIESRGGLNIFRLADAKAARRQDRSSYQKKPGNDRLPNANPQENRTLEWGARVHASWHWHQSHTYNLWSEAYNREARTVKEAAGACPSYIWLRETKTADDRQAMENARLRRSREVITPLPIPDKGRNPNKTLTF